MGPDAMIFVFWMLSFKPTFLLSYFTFIKSRVNIYSCPHTHMREYIDILWITFINILLFLQKTKHKHNKYFFIPTYTLESLGLQGNQTSQSLRILLLDIHWKDWHWSWNFNSLATSCKELAYCRSPWCWERLKAGGEADNRRWDGWVASSTRGIWV